MRCTHAVAALVITSAGLSAHAALIGVDDRHGFDADAIFATGADYDTFRQTILDAGHTIVPLTSFEAGDLAGLDGLIASVAYDQNTSNYTASEIAAIQAFTGNRAVFISDKSLWSDDADTPITFGDNKTLLVNAVDFIAGGGTIFNADDGGGFDVGNFNALTSPWGVTFAASPTDPSGRAVGGILPSPITTNASTLGVDFQLPITSFGITTDLTGGGGQDNILAFIPAPAAALPLLLAGGMGVRRRC